MHVHVVFNLGESSEPNDLQIDAFRSFMDRRSVLFVELEQQLFEYYNRVSRDVDLDDETHTALFPTLANARDLGSMIQLTGILVDYFDDARHSRMRPHYSLRPPRLWTSVREFAGSHGGTKAQRLEQRERGQSPSSWA